MTIPRIPNAIMYDQSSRSVTNAAVVQGRINDDLASGTRLHTASDDPAAVTRVIAIDDTLGKITGWNRSAVVARSVAVEAEQALTGISEDLRVVRGLVTQAASGTYNADQLKNIKQQVQQLTDHIRSMMNTQADGRYVFSGAKTDTMPFPAGGNLYAGDQETLTVNVGDGVDITTHQPGTNVFGADGGNLLDTLDAIIAHLDSADRDALGVQDVNALDANVLRLLNRQTAIGGEISRMDGQVARLAAVEQQLQAERSTIADTDFAKASVDYARAQTIYQSTLAVTARILSQPRLVDFLR